MILIINNCASTIDEATNLYNLIAFMKKYKIRHKICNTMEDVMNVDKNLIRGIIMTGSTLRLNKDLMHPKTQMCVYVYTHYQKKKKIPIYGMCFSCQLMNILCGGQLYELSKEFCQTIDIKLDQRNHIFKNASQIETFVCFNDLPIPTMESLHYLKETSWDLNNHNPMAYKYKNRPWYFSMYHPEVKECTHWILINFICNICHEPIMTV
jgi:anthranilate/para-aminobenzoate synthase component II